MLRQDPELRDRFSYSEFKTSLDHTRLRLGTAGRKKKKKEAATTTTGENPGWKSLEVLTENRTGGRNPGAAPSPGRAPQLRARSASGRTDLRGGRPGGTEPDRRPKQPPQNAAELGQGAVGGNLHRIQAPAASARQRNQTSRAGRGGAHGSPRPSPGELGRGREGTGRGYNGAGRDRLQLLRDTRRA